MASHRHTHKKARPTPLLILLVVLIGVGLLAAALYDRYQSRLEAARYEGEALYHPELYRLTVDGKTYGLKKKLDSYLLIGLDKYSTQNPDPEAHRNEQQADFLFLMLVDHESKSYCALHINRDTMTEIQRYGLAGMKLKSFTGQLALSHTYGSGGRDSCRYTSEAVSGLLLGVPIEHYMSLTMDAIPVLNDLVGGVSVLIEDDFSRVDASLVQGQTQRLIGDQALTFVRSRAGMDDASNLNRMERQRVYLNGLYEQLTLMLHQEDGFGLRMGTELSGYMVSDMTVETLAALAEQVKDYRYLGIESIQGEARLGEQFMEFYADEAALQQQLIRLMLTELS